MSVSASYRMPSASIDFHVYDQSDFGRLGCMYNKSLVEYRSNDIASVAEGMSYQRVVLGIVRLWAMRETRVIGMPPYSKDIN